MEKKLIVLAREMEKLRVEIANTVKSARASAVAITVVENLSIKLGIKNQVNIHTLDTDYWRRIQDFPCSHLICTPGIFVDDTLNWFAYDPYLPKLIVSLDLEKESYQKLSLPFSGIHLEIPMTLGILRGCLSILSNRFENSKFSNVWIMKEYGNEKSWIKLLSVPLIKECGLYDGYSKILYISENDQLLVEFYKMENRGLVVYDSINNIFTILKMQSNIHGLKVRSHFYVREFGITFLGDLV
ncbi:unnamed protein product [Vicia faba]|uniref:F-box associated beta-propeller type 1 domain-containing protein n=1 Tax=Vicia faba TaxID=3906 RepID=A0AAV0YT98_VICFA|nr:unnamed protein product [Vicia faba]